MATVKKYQAGGVASKKKKAPMVDPKGAWTKVLGQRCKSALLAI